MKPEQVVEALEEAAARLGVRVRYDALGPSGVSGSGGLCKVKGEWWLIIDKKTTPAERVAMVAEALSGFDTEALDLPTKARDAIQARRALKQPPAASSEP